jgi:UDP-sulfoquinovose synthase
MDRNCILVCGYDGYIGNALVQRLLNRGYKVIGLDDMSRRKNVYACGSDSLFPRPSKETTEEEFKKFGDFTAYHFDVITKVKDLLKVYKPFTVVNLAHLPSAPFSMKSKQHAEYTLQNNIIGTNEILWGIKEFVPEAHYVTIGSTGEYDHKIGIDIEEGYTTIESNGRTSEEVIFPRRANSIYHASKIASTYLIDYCSRIWGLRSTDVQQAIVYGAYTDEIANGGIPSRFDIDESFGTVINRFIYQAYIGKPITVYGKGYHKRAFLSLNDSVQALEIAIENTPLPGKPRVWNQLTDWCSINDIAKIVSNIAKEFDIDTKIVNIDSPRKEFTGDHYYNFKTDILKSFGYKMTRSLENEIRYLFLSIDPAHIKALNLSDEVKTRF